VVGNAEVDFVLWLDLVRLRAALAILGVSPHEFVFPSRLGFANGAWFKLGMLDLWLITSI
jgi:hypothetical protein